MAASLLGEGTITLVNLARKLINIPLIALMSLNQVLLSRMSGETGLARASVLNRGLDLCTLLTVPAAAGFVGAAPALVALLLPRGLTDGPLPALLACYSVSIVFGAWNAMLARYSYAGGDTRSPLGCEMVGATVHASLLFLLPLVFGIFGLAGAAFGGVTVTGILLTLKLQRKRLGRLLLQEAVVLIVLGLVAVTLFPFKAHGPLLQLLASAALAASILAGLARWLRPWQTTDSPVDQQPASIKML
jgi:peptidoglycan biosynthesis protein MviN/MurJ (putative lipid II flippase)